MPPQEAYGCSPTSLCSRSLSQGLQSQKLTKEQKPLPASPGTACPAPPPPPHFLGAEKSLPTCAASCSATQLDPAHSGSSSGRESCAECRGRNTSRRLPEVYCAPRSLPPQGLCSYCPSGTFSYTLPPYNTAKHPHALNGLHPRRRGRSHEESLHEDLPPGVL